MATYNLEDQEKIDSLKAWWPCRAFYNVAEHVYIIVFQQKLDSKSRS